MPVPVIWSSRFTSPHPNAGSALSAGLAEYRWPLAQPTHPSQYRAFTQDVSNRLFVCLVPGHWPRSNCCRDLDQRRRSHDFDSSYLKTGARQVCDVDNPLIHHLVVITSSGIQKSARMSLRLG